MTEVVCNGDRKCKEERCFHHKHHPEDIGCYDDCRNHNDDVRGSVCIKVISI